MPPRDESVLRTATMGTAMPTADPPPPGRDDPVVDALWKAHRRRMLDIAFRILLDLGDAEDVVQEAFSRLARADVAAIDDPDAWPQVALWGLALTATALLAWTISRRTGHNWIGALAGIVGLVAWFGWSFMHDYQRKRVLTFLDPSTDPSGA